ncbi:MAG: hypothetical protein QNJ97_23885 [Myxococcota bacterium]|nr:hypothetical protein [Myxococcota bacterium]
MTKRMPLAIAMIVLCGAMGLSCKEWMVGAPCIPETESGRFLTSLSSTNTIVETRSVQCETSICLTVTKLVPGEVPDPDAENAFEAYEGTQNKYSFCSCQCRDADDNEYDRNDDKLDRLCKCPPNTYCERVLNNIEGAPPKIIGSYCIPKCIQDDCQDGTVCSPSTNADAPWDWKCK